MRDRHRLISTTEAVFTAPLLVTRVSVTNSISCSVGLQFVGYRSSTAVVRERQPYAAANQPRDADARDQ